MLSNNDQKILHTLLEEPLNFNAVRARTLISPRYLRQFLDDLERRRLVREDKENWRRGCRKFYSLTERGETALLQNLNGRLCGLLERFRQFMSYIRYDSKQSERKHWQTRLRRILSKTENDIAGRLLGVKELYDPLYDCARMMHEFLLYFHLGSKQDPREYIENKVLCFFHGKNKTELYFIQKEEKKMQALADIIEKERFAWLTKEEIDEARKRQGGTFKVTRYTRKKS
jgi:DNA-binding PadR family transcriptional regulator